MEGTAVLGTPQEHPRDTPPRAWQLGSRRISRGSRGSCPHTRKEGTNANSSPNNPQNLGAVKSVPRLCFYLKPKNPRSHRPSAFSRQTLRINRARPDNGSSCSANHTGILLELFPCLHLFTQGLLSSSAHQKKGLSEG